MDFDKRASLCYLLHGQENSKQGYFVQCPTLSTSKAWLVASLSETNKLDIDTIQNSQDDQIILHTLGIGGNLSNAPSMMQVSWQLPPTQMALLKQLLIFQDVVAFSRIVADQSRDFSISLRTLFDFDVEVRGIIIAIEKAKEIRWSSLQVETNSIYVAIIFCGYSTRNRKRR